MARMKLERVRELLYLRTISGLPSERARGDSRARARGHPPARLSPKLDVALSKGGEDPGHAQLQHHAARPDFPRSSTANKRRTTLATP